MNYRTEGIVLKRKDTGEADRILTILSRDRGIIKAIAKASRLPMSKLGGFIDLFAHVDIALAEGRTFDVVTEVKTLATFTKLRTNVKHNLYASHIAELVIRSSHEGDSGSGQLFSLVAGTFTYLAEHTHTPLLLPSFRMKFLSLYGYAPSLDQCAGCGNGLKQETNYLNYSYDSILCPVCHNALIVENLRGRALTADTLKLLRLLAVSSYEVLDLIRIPAPLQADIEELTEQLIQYHVAVPLKSSITMKTIAAHSSLGIHRE